MLYWIWLSEVKGIGPVMQKRLLAYLQSPKAIYTASSEELMNVPGIGCHLAEEITTSSLKRAQEILGMCNGLNIQLLTFHDERYPSRAKEYPLCPILLYYRGHLVENSIGVGIVGARRCSSYGKEIAKQAGQYLAQNNIPVISGMAKGIDGYAHISCLKAGGYTLAFLGSGVDICYPKEHDELMARIMESGAVLSQYPPETKPKPQYFPKRNALISAWSEKILVVEAGAKSGALITAQYTKQLKREVLAVPNQIYSQMGKGTNQLIKEGATIYLGPEQLINTEPVMNVEAKIIGDNGLKPVKGNKKRKAMEAMKIASPQVNTPTEQRVIDALFGTPKTMAQIVEETKLQQLVLLEVMTILELEGKISSLPGGKWVKEVI
ncbi:DNA protecting protein DprA [Alkaliphilus metalliredigens QYMF]|uniref:DNA protecting protein DprA n=1 Tax=Alkaliphilus metalliredigens (strain QYMF) TaxID=293826 RepID=A6TJT8_ALKMQ|nr:DNA-processing protein DprA [Alkaliphilus metalliredigens]ABR46456.1 DNA protecting protein DprA [Alkaliphilus metalliredigens QYMF]